MLLRNFDYSEQEIDSFIGKVSLYQAKTKNSYYINDNLFSFSFNFLLPSKIEQQEASKIFFQFTPEKVNEFDLSYDLPEYNPTMVNQNSVSTN